MLYNFFHWRNTSVHNVIRMKSFIVQCAWTPWIKPWRNSVSTFIFATTLNCFHYLSIWHSWNHRAIRLVFSQHLLISQTIATWSSGVLYTPWAVPIETAKQSHLYAQRNECFSSTVVIIASFLTQRWCRLCSTKSYRIHLPPQGPRH